MFAPLFALTPGRSIPLTPFPVKGEGGAAAPDEGGWGEGDSSRQMTHSLVVLVGADFAPGEALGQDGSRPVVTAWVG